MNYRCDDTIYKAFKEARNSARQAINSARATFVKEGIASNQNAPKCFWARLKKIMPGKKIKPDQTQAKPRITLVDPDSNSGFSTDLEMLNHANNFL